MKMTLGMQKMNELYDQGWEFSHDALVNRYQCAGTVSPMRSRDGYEYCRVHHGRRVGHHSYQITSVMRRKVG